MDRRIALYKKYHQGYGEILVQMNVEDTRLGVAEYIIDKHKLDTIELKWGQGAKCIGGEIKVNSLGARSGTAEARLYCHPRSVRSGRAGSVQGNGDQGIRTPQPSRIHRRAGVLRRGRSACASSGSSGSP